MFWTSKSFDLSPTEAWSCEDVREGARIKAYYYGMISLIDKQVGRIVETLRWMDALDNTLILFLSDNGASAEIMVRDDGHNPSAEPGSAARR